MPNSPTTLNHAELTQWRRHLHQNPELMFDVGGTAAFVVEKLKVLAVMKLSRGLAKPGWSASFKRALHSSAESVIVPGKLPFDGAAY